MSDCLRSACCCSCPCRHHSSDEESGVGENTSLLGRHVVPDTAACSGCQMMCDRCCSSSCFKRWAGRAMMLTGGAALVLGTMAAWCDFETESSRPPFCGTEPISYMLSETRFRWPAFTLIAGFCTAFVGFFLEKSGEQNT